MQQEPPVLLPPWMQIISRIAKLVTECSEPNCRYSLPHIFPNYPARSSTVQSHNSSSRDSPIPNRPRKIN
ncbi:hypothetical protein ECG_00439 [Echinococcus granulosus]|nr:hypothetical protein ECG_00439 [Echinococcus granulosus]